jgi:hypothetical protein
LIDAVLPVPIIATTLIPVASVADAKCCTTPLPATV